MRSIPRLLMLICLMTIVVNVPVRANDKAAEHLSKGMVLAQDGDINGAIAEYRKALKIDPDFADAHNNLGLALEKNRNLDAAIAEFREALRVAPDDAVVPFNLGIALRAKGDTVAAIAEYNAAIVANPELIEARSNLGASVGRARRFGWRDRAISRSAADQS